MRRGLFIAILSVLAALPAAAKVSVEARIDSMEILIGQQVHVMVIVTAGDASTVIFPDFKPKQMITQGVEVLDATDLPKESIDNGLASYRRAYRLTSFDGNLYYLPPFVVKVDGKSYKSKSLALKVLEVEIDTTHVDFVFGPKDVQDNPFLWSEWSPAFWLSIIMLLLIAASYYIYLLLRDRKPIKINLKVIKRLLPHQKAMREIEIIKADKMVLSENQKEYYTKLTDVLRKYIQERYGFCAMEMTSSEIIDRLKMAPDLAAIEELRTLFQTADLVKFAKYSTQINENDMNLVTAVDFINSTKIENMPTEDVVKPTLTEEEIQTVKTRRILQTLITLTVTLSILIFGYVAYYTYQLLD